MIYLLTAAFSITTLSLIMRYSTLKTKTPWGVIQANYITAAAIMAAIIVATRALAPSTFTLTLGAITGLTYTAGMYLNLNLMSKRGAAITSSMIQLAVLIPITASIILYKETITLTQLAGILLAVTSLPLLASKPMQKIELDKQLLPMIITTIIVVGFSQLSTRGRELLLLPSHLHISINPGNPIHTKKQVKHPAQRRSLRHRSRHIQHAEQHEHTTGTHHTTRSHRLPGEQRRLTTDGHNISHHPIQGKSIPVKHHGNTSNPHRSGTHQHLGIP